MVQLNVRFRVKPPTAVQAELFAQLVRQVSGCNSRSDGCISEKLNLRLWSESACITYGVEKLVAM